MKEKYSASAIANYFIKKGTEENVPGMTQMKIQKLVYMAYGFSLSLFNLDIIGGEDVKAWEHGPVIPSLYHSLKSYGRNVVSNPIEETYDEFDGGGATTPEVDPNDEDTLSVLDAVWRLYRHKSAAELRNLTHEQNTPWSMNYREHERNVVIPRSHIKAFYDVLFDKVVKQ